MNPRIPEDQPQQVLAFELSEKVPKEISLVYFFVDDTDNGEILKGGGGNQILQQFLIFIQKYSLGT